MSKKLILTLDIGTTSVKVSLFTDELIHLCSFAEEYPLENKTGGIVEVNPELYKNAIKIGLSKALAHSGDIGEIFSISVTTQGETLIPVDEKGSPLMNAIVWLDCRATLQSEKLSKLIDTDEFYKTTGLPEINGSLPLSKLCWIKENLPQIYDKAYKFLMVEDYILYWLTGKFVTEKSLQCSSGYFDIINDCYWDKALLCSGISKEKLPIALSCGKAISNIIKKTADELSISADAIVCTGAMDQVATAFGAGCTTEGMVVETTGTALVMAAYTKNPCFEQASRVTIYRHAIDGSYLYIPIGNTAGMLLKWFKDNFCGDITACGQSIYSVMDEFAAKIPAGCDGLITLPFLAGNVNPDLNSNAKAVFFGAQLCTTRAHFIRSIMESVCFMLKDFIQMLEKLGLSANVIHSIGGGSRSRLWQQMKADICNITYSSMQCSEMASMGAAKLAAIGSGLAQYDKLQKALVKEDYIPNTDLNKIYNAAYEKYCKLYNAVKELY